MEQAEPGLEQEPAPEERPDSEPNDEPDQEQEQPLSGAPPELEEADRASEENVNSSAEAPQPDIQTDPTTANAGLTEISIPVSGTPSDPNQAATDAPHIIPQSDIDAGAANESASARFGGASGDGAEEWVQVPRDPAETETGITATPAAAGGTQSWADEPTESHEQRAAEEGDLNDGFHEVHHSRGGRGRHGAPGEYRGGYRGRGYRSYEGGGYRGRGGYRGGEGGYRSGDGGYRGGEGGYRGSEGGYRGGDGGFRGGDGGYRGEGGYRGRGRGGFRGGRGRDIS